MRKNSVLSRLTGPTVCFLRFQLGFILFFPQFFICRVKTESQRSSASTRRTKWEAREERANRKERKERKERRGKIANRLEEGNIDIEKTVLGDRLGCAGNAK